MGLGGLMNAFKHSMVLVAMTCALCVGGCAGLPEEKLETGSLAALPARVPSTDTTVINGFGHRNSLWTAAGAFMIWVYITSRH